MAISTGSSYLSELFVNDKEKNASNLVALSTTLGFGGGALFTSIFLAFYSTLVPATYWLILIASVFWIIISLSLPESKINKKKKLIRLPLFPKGSFKFNISIALFWAVTGIVISIIPSQISKFNLGGWSGLALFLINGTGALFLPLAKRMTENKSLKIAYILLPIGFAMLTIGSIYGILAFILIGSSVIGIVSYGFGYFGTLVGVSKLNTNEKPRVVSGYLLFAYLGFGIPSIIIGLTSEKYGIENSLVVYLILTTLISMILLILNKKTETTTGNTVYSK